MRSTRAQLLLTVAALATAAAFLIHRGPPPSRGIDIAGEAFRVEIPRALRWGVSPNAHSYPGWFPALHQPIIEGDRDTVGLLIHAGADLSATFGSNGTPLIWAATWRPDPDMVRLLLDHGADPRVSTTASGTVLQALVNTADRSGEFAEPVPPDPEVEQKRVLIARMLIDAGASVNPPAPPYAHSAPLLHRALAHRHDEIARILIEAGADIDAKAREFSYIDLDGTEVEIGDSGYSRYYDEETPLMIAADTGNADLVRFLLAHGAHPFARNADGASAMHYAAVSENTQIPRLIADAGVMDRDDAGDTPLHWAAQWKDVSLDVVRVLLTLGADPRAANNEGRTPLDIATDRGYTAIADVLRQGAADGPLEPTVENLPPAP